MHNPEHNPDHCEDNTSNRELEKIEKQHLVFCTKDNDNNSDDVDEGGVVVVVVEEGRVTQQTKLCSLEAFYRAVDDMIATGLAANNLPRRTLLTMTQLSFLEQAEMNKLQKRAGILSQNQIFMNTIKGDDDDDDDDDDVVKRKELQQLFALQTTHFNTMYRNIPLYIEELYKMLTTLYDVQKYFFNELRNLLQIHIQPWIQPGDHLSMSAYKELIREVLQFYSSILVPFERSINPITKNSHMFDVYPCELKTPHSLKILFLCSPPDSMMSQELVASFIATALYRTPTIEAPQRQEASEKDNGDGDKIQAVSLDPLLFMKDMFAGLCYGTLAFVGLPSDHVVHSMDVNETNDDDDDDDDDGTNGNRRDMEKRIYEFYMDKTETDILKAHPTLTTRRFNTMVSYALGFELREKQANLKGILKRNAKNFLVPSQNMQGDEPDNTMVNEEDDEEGKKKPKFEENPKVLDLMNRLKKLELEMLAQQVQMNKLKTDGDDENEPDENDQLEKNIQTSRKLLEKLNTTSTVNHIKQFIEDYDSSLKEITSGDSSFFQNNAKILLETEPALFDSQERELVDHAREVVLLMEKWLFCIGIQNIELQKDILLTIRSRYRKAIVENKTEQEITGWHLSLAFIENRCRKVIMKTVSSLEDDDDDDKSTTAISCNLETTGSSGGGKQFISFLKVRIREEERECVEQSSFTDSLSSSTISFLKDLGLTQEQSDGLFSYCSDGCCKDVIPSTHTMSKSDYEKGGTHGVFYKVGILLETLGEDNVVCLCHPFIFNLNIVCILEKVLTLCEDEISEFSVLRSENGQENGAKKSDGKGDEEEGEEEEEEEGGPAYSRSFKTLFLEHGEIEDQIEALIESRVTGKRQRNLLRKCFEYCEFLSTQGGYRLFTREHCVDFIRGTRDSLRENYVNKVTKQRALKRNNKEKSNPTNTKTQETRWLFDNNGGENALAFLSDLLTELNVRLGIETPPPSPSPQDSKQQQQPPSLPPTKDQESQKMNGDTYQGLWHSALVSYMLQIQVGDKLQIALLKFIKTLSENTSF